MEILEYLEIFKDLFKEHMVFDDCMDWKANKITKDGETYLRIRSFPAEKVSKVVLEDYVIRDKLKGIVIIVYPSPSYAIPAFTFQVGGRNENKTLGVLDMAPTLPNVDFSPVKPLYEKHCNLLGVKPCKIEWLNSICSKYLIHCNYKFLDRELFKQALIDYFNVWYKQYYLPAKKINNKKTVKTITKYIRTYKEVLHHNDPAYGIFTRAWGKPVSDAYIYLEYGDYPALVPPKKFKYKFKIWENKKLGMKWEKEAQLRVMEAPKFIRSYIRKTIENKVFDAQINVITLEVFNKYKENRPGDSQTE